MMRERPEQVGVRALRQNLSSFLERVREGETVEVTDHGRPIARLTPVPSIDDPLERLAAEGRVIRAAGRMADILPVRGKPDPELSRAIMEALEEQRQDKI